MKTIEKTTTIESKYNVYVANDGTEFKDADECKKYEESAYGVLNVRYKELLVRESTNFDLFGVGSDDYYIDIVKVRTKDDADVVMQMYFLFNSYVLERANNGEKFYQGWIDRARTLLNNAIDEDDFLFIGRGDKDTDVNSGVFWFIGTRASVLANIQECINKGMEK